MRRNLDEILERKSRERYSNELLERSMNEREISREASRFSTVSSTQASFNHENIKENGYYQSVSRSSTQATFNHAFNTLDRIKMEMKQTRSISPSKRSASPTRRVGEGLSQGSLKNSVEHHMGELRSLIDNLRQQNRNLQNSMEWRGSTTFTSPQKLTSENNAGHISPTSLNLIPQVEKSLNSNILEKERASYNPTLTFNNSVGSTQVLSVVNNFEKENIELKDKLNSMSKELESLKKDNKAISSNNISGGDVLISENKLEKENLELREKIMGLNNELEEAKNQIQIETRKTSDLVKSLEKADNDNTKNNATSKNDENVDELNLSIKNYEKENNVLVKRLKFLNEKMETEKRENQRDLFEIENNNNQLLKKNLSKIEELENSVKHYECELDKKNNEIEEERKQRQREVFDLENKNGALLKKMEEYPNKTAEEKSAALPKNDSKVEELEHLISKYEEDYKNLLLKLKSAEKELEDSKKQWEDSKKQMQVEVFNLENKNSELVKSLEIANTAIEEKGASSSKNDSKVKELERTIDKYEEDNKKLLLKLNAIIIELEDSKKQRQVEVFNLENKNSELVKSLEIANKAIAEKSALPPANDTIVEDLQKLNNNFEKDNIELKKQIESLNDMITKREISSKKDYDLLKENLNKKDLEMQENKESVLTEITLLKGNIVKKEEEIKISNSKAGENETALSKKILALQESLALKENDLKNSKRAAEENDALRKEIATLKESLIKKEGEKKTDGEIVVSAKVESGTTNTKEFTDKIEKMQKELNEKDDEIAFLSECLKASTDYHKDAEANAKIEDKPKTVNSIKAEFEKNPIFQFKKIDATAASPSTTTITTSPPTTPTPSLDHAELNRPKVQAARKKKSNR